MNTIIKGFMVLAIVLLIGINFFTVDTNAAEASLWWNYAERWYENNGSLQVTRYVCDYPQMSYGACYSTNGVLRNYYEFPTGRLWEEITYF